MQAQVKGTTVKILWYVISLAIHTQLLGIIKNIFQSILKKLHEY